MNPFQNLKIKLDERRRTKLRNDLKAIAEMDYQFNPFKNTIPQNLSEKEIDLKQLIERLVWFSANPEAIHEYYSKNRDSNVNIKSSYFWASAPAKLRHVHSGIPNLISEKMGEILFNHGLKFNVEVKNEKGDPLKQKSKEATKILNEIVDELNLIELFMSGAVINSWSGHIDFKLSYDLSLSYKPIINVYDRRFFSIRKVRGITIDHVFSQWFQKTKGSQTKGYLLEEIYSHDEHGFATIENHLYELKQNQRVEVPLTTIEETASINPSVTLQGFYGFAAFDLPNLANSSVRLNYPYGKSDYEGAFDAFDGLDETVTQIVSEIRDKKPIREFDERALKTDQETGEKFVGEYVTNYVKLPHSNAENSKVVDVTEFTDATAAHVAKFERLLSLVCALCGISPISLGIPGLNAIDASDKSTREKSKTTTDTRKKKIQLWKPFIESFVKKVILFSKWLTTLEGYDNLSLESLEWKKKLDSVDWENVIVSITFPDYLVEAKESKINTASSAVTNGVMSLETAIEEIYGDDWTEQQKQEEANRILFRQGLMQDSVDLAMLENGTIDGNKIADKIEDKANNPNNNV